MTLAISTVMMMTKFPKATQCCFKTNPRACDNARACDNQLFPMSHNTLFYNFSNPESHKLPELVYAR